MIDQNCQLIDHNFFSKYKNNQMKKIVTRKNVQLLKIQVKMKNFKIDKLTVLK